MALPEVKPVDERIRERLFLELDSRRQVLHDQKIVDRVLLGTTERIAEYLEALAKEVAQQQAAMGHLQEIREQQHDLAHHASETALLGVNLADVFFRSDFRLLIKHLSVAEDEIILSALTKDSKLLKRLKELIQRIDTLQETHESK